MRMLICLLTLALTAGSAHADLNGYLEELSFAVRGDSVDFAARLGARFGLPRGEVELVLTNVHDPVDAALVLWLGEQSRQPRERVLEVYRDNIDRGWGAVAQRLGIKPGSAAFHRLKAGDIGFPAGGEDGRSGPGKGHHGGGKKSKPGKKH